MWCILEFLDRSRWKQRPMWRTSLPEKMVLWRSRDGLSTSQSEMMSHGWSAMQPVVNFTLHEIFRTLFGLQKGQVKGKDKWQDGRHELRISMFWPANIANGFIWSELTCSKEQPTQCCQIPGLERSIVLRCFTFHIITILIPSISYCQHLFSIWTSRHHRFPMSIHFSCFTVPCLFSQLWISDFSHPMAAATELPSEISVPHDASCGACLLELNEDAGNQQVSMKHCILNGLGYSNVDIRGFTWLNTW